MELQDHQKEAIKRLNGGMIYYHGLGTGKTFTSIAATGKYDKVNVVTPASLRENYKKEIVKAGVKAENYNVGSYDQAQKKAPPTADAIIVDEVHRISEPSSKRSRAILDIAKSHKTRIGLTATPIVNRPSDLAPLAHFVDPNSDIPMSRKEFDKRYIGTHKPNVVAKLFGARDSNFVSNKKELKKAFKGRMHYVPGGEKDFPEVKTEYVDVRMTKPQERLYKTLAHTANPLVAFKVRHMIPLSSQELKTANSFMSATRQASNDPQKFGNHGEGSKVKRAIIDMVEASKKDPNYKGLVYSNYIKSGTSLMTKELDANGIPYRIFNGSLGDEVRKKAVADYNSGAAKALLISSAGAEGLDLKGTKMVQVLEPHWNNNRIRQVIGRAARYKSHDALPEKERKVVVRRYQSTLRRGASADVYLNDMAKKKDELNDKFLEVLKEVGK